MSLSPYALLKASIPKPPQTITTDYDLYSLAGSSAAADASAQKAQPVPSVKPQAVIAPAPGRTHYIADIHARHTGAMRQARQQSAQL